MSQDAAQESLTESNDTLLSLTATTTPAGMVQSPAATDPFVGGWECRSYLTSGPLRKVYTFLEDGTWVRTNTNLESLVQSHAHGTWKKESEGAYVIHSLSSGGTANFEYDKEKDTWYDPHFQETFHRIPNENVPTTDTPPLSLTGSSPQKLTKIQGVTPNSGKIFLLIYLSIENLNEPGGFVLEEKNIRVVYNEGPDSWSITQKMASHIDDPLSPGAIALGETRQGNVVFGIPENTASCTVKIVNNEGDAISNSLEFTDIPTTSAPGVSFGDPELLANKNFTFVVERLNTPEIASQYTNAKFTFGYHDGCKSYPPEDFFRIGMGDCKDYATFLSYVLDHHGYEVNMIAFKYFKNGARNGHVVTLFTDDEGTMYYMTTPDVSILRKVSSLEDLFDKEGERLGFESIASSRTLPAGSLDTCLPDHNVS